jgi:hypothetical protein
MTDGGFVLNGELSSHPWCPIVLIPIYNLKNYWQPAFKWEDFQAQGHNNPRFVKLICIFFIKFYFKFATIKNKFPDINCYCSCPEILLFLPIKAISGNISERTEDIIVVVSNVFFILFF